MLKLLKESVTSRHGERLEQIVIVLIGIEICKSNEPLSCSPHNQSFGYPILLHSIYLPRLRRTLKRNFGTTRSAVSFDSIPSTIVSSVFSYAPDLLC